MILIIFSTLYKIPNIFTILEQTYPLSPNPAPSTDPTLITSFVSPYCKDDDSQTRLITTGDYNLLERGNLYASLLAKCANVSIKYSTQLTKNNGLIRKVNTILANLCPVDIKWHVADTLENINNSSYNSFSYCLNHQTL